MAVRTKLVAFLFYLLQFFVDRPNGRFEVVGQAFFVLECLVKLNVLPLSVCPSLISFPLSRVKIDELGDEEPVNG